MNTLRNQNISVTSSQLSNSAALVPVANFVDMLGDSPFIGDVNSFRIIPMAQVPKNSAYSYLVYMFWQSSGVQYINLRVLLRDVFAKRNATFGSELAQLSDNKRQEVINCLARYWDAIQKLDSKRQQEISMMVSDTVGLPAAQDDSLSEASRKVAARLIELVSEAGKEKVAEFLKNKQFENFNVSPSQFMENTANLISSVVAYDADAGIEILLKAEQLIADARRRGQFNYNTSQGLTARVVSRMQNDSRNFNFGSIGFLVKLARDTNEPELSLEPSYVMQMEYPLYERFNQYRNASNNNSMEALKTMYEDIGPYVGKSDLCGISMLFRREFESGSWNETIINETLNWAKREVESGKYPNLAKVLAINAAFYKQQRYRGSTRNNPGASTDDYFAEIQPYYREIIADNNSSLLWRLLANYSFEQLISRDPSFISYNAGNEQQNSNKEMLLQQISLITKGWSVYPNLNAEFCTNTIRRFSQAASPQDSSFNRNMQNTIYIPREEWLEAATKLVDAYMAMRNPKPVPVSSGSVSSIAARGGGFSTRVPVSSPVMVSRSSSYDNNPNIQLTMLEINLLLNRMDAARQMLDGFDSRVGMYLDCWALLVRYNQPQIFRSVVDKNLSNNINQMGLVRFDKQIEKNLSSCLDVLQAPDIRYFTEVMISSLQDERSSTQMPSKERNMRLKLLADKFGDVVFNSSPLKFKILELYVNDSQLLPMVSRHVIEAGRNADLGALGATQNSSQARTQARILSYYCMNELTNGDPNAFFRVTRAFSSYSSQNLPSGVRYIFESLSQEIMNKTNTIDSTWSKDQFSIYADACTELISIPNFNYDPSRMISNVIVFNVLAGKEDKIPAAMERCSPQIRQRLSSYASLSGLSNALGRAVRAMNLSLDKRIDIIKRFYQTDPVQAAMTREGQSNLLSILMNYRVLTRQEIEVNGDLLRDLFIQTKQIEAFLQAKNLREINISSDQAQLRQYVSSLLNSTMWQDADLCLKIIKKAGLFISQTHNQDSVAAVRKMQNEFLSSILQQRDSTYFSIADLGIITGLVRDANGPQVVLSTDYLKRISQTILERYQQILTENNRNNIEAVKSFYELVGPYFGKGNASGMSGFCTMFFQYGNWNQADINSLTEWLNKEIESGKYPGLAREIKFAFSSYFIRSFPSRRSSPIPPPDISTMTRSDPGRRGAQPPMTRGGLGGRIEQFESATNPDINEYKDYYSKVIADSSLSVIWRLMSVEEYRKRSRPFGGTLALADTSDLMNSEMVLQAVPLVIEGWKLYPDLPDVYCNAIVSDFLKLRDKPGWIELAEQLSDAYQQVNSNSSSQSTQAQEEFSVQNRNMLELQARQQVLMTRGGSISNPPSMTRGGGFGGSTVYSSQNIDPALIAQLIEQSRRQTEAQNVQPQSSNLSAIEKSMLEIRLIIDKNEMIQTQLNKPKSSLGKSLDTWALLLQYGKNSMLTDLIEKNWQAVSTNSSLLFTEEMENNIGKCLEKISREDIRYFADAVLSSLADSKEDGQIPQVSHKERIIRLARQYSKINFDDLMIKQRILALLINEPDALEFVRDSLSEQVKNIDLSSLFVNFNNSSKDQFNLVLATCCEKLITGDPNSFINTVKSIVFNIPSSSNLSIELLNSMAEGLRKTADSIKSNWSVRQMAALGNASSEFFTQNDYPVNSMDNLFINHYIFFVLGGQEKQIQKAYARFSSQTGRIFQNEQRYERLPVYYDQMAEYLVNRNLSFEQRLDIVKRFQKADWIANSWRPGMGVPNLNIVQMFVDFHIFTRQETIDNSSSFIEFTNPAIASFLNIQRPEDLDMGSLPFEIQVNNLLESVDIYDTQTVLKILVKANELYQLGLKSDIVRSPFGQDYMGRILIQLMRREGNMLPGLSLIVKLMRDTKDHQLFPDSYFYRIDMDVVNALIQSSNSDMLQSDKFETVKNLYQQIGPCVGNGNASGVAGIFSTILSRMEWNNNQLLESIINWSHQQAENGTYPSLAREIEMVATVYRYRTLSGEEPEEEKIRPVVEYYKKVLTDENLALQWRLMTVHALERWTFSRIYDELIDASIPLLIKSSSQFTSFNWDTYPTLLTRYVRVLASSSQGQNNEPPDKDLAVKLLNAYMESHTGLQQNMNSLPPSFRGTTYRQSASMPELVMLETSLILKDNQTAMRLLNDNDGTLKTSSCSLALLIQYQNSSLFESFVRNNIENILLDSRGLYDPNMEERITESLSNITQKDWQFYIRALLYSHRDNPGPVNENALIRIDHLKKLAMEFPDIKFQSESLKKKTLTLLIQELSTLLYLSQPLAEQTKSIDFASMVSVPQSYMMDEPNLQLFVADKMNMLLKNDTSGFMEMIRIIRNIGTDSQFGGNSNTYNYTRILYSDLLQIMTSSDWNAENLGAFLKVSKELLSTIDGQSFSSNITRLICCRVALLLLTDESSLSESDRQKEIESAFGIIRQFLENRVPQSALNIRVYDLVAPHQTMGRYMNSVDMPFKKRMEILDKFYSLEPIANALNNQQRNYSMLSLILSGGILSAKEVVAHTDTLMTRPEINSDCWMVLAVEQEKQGLLDDAEKSWRKAVEMTIKSENPSTNMQGYILFLKKNNLIDKALDNWRSFNKESLSQKSISEYNALIQSLGAR